MTDTGGRVLFSVMPLNENYPSLSEEIANSITHGLGAVFSIAALVVMIAVSVVHGTAWHVVSSIIYGTTLLLLYLSSTLYHSLTNPKAKKLFRIVDHSAIYLLIAGTYTPFTLITLRGAWGWTLFGVIWGLAIAGVIFKCFLTGRLNALSTAVYIGMGWLAVFAVRPLLHALPLSGFIWLLAGGLCYTSGVLFFAWERKYAHSIWHLFVLAGSTCHFFAVYWYVLPARIQG